MAMMTEPPFFARIRRLFGFAMLALGAAFVIGSLVVLSARWSWHANSSMAVGEVVAHTSAMNRSGTAGRPPRNPSASSRSEVVRFTDAQGATREFTSALATSRPFGIGERVSVRFTAESPDDAVIDTWFRMWGFPLIFAGAGAFQMIVGTVFLLSGRRIH